jgi:two-component system sensor histidine kinase YesM
LFHTKSMMKFTYLPIKFKLIVFFLPLIVLSVLLSGLFSYWLASKQIRENAHLLLNDTVHQTGIFINDKLLTMFEQLVLIEDDKAIRNVIIREGNETDEDRIIDMIDISNRFKEIYARNHSMLDSIYVKLNNGREFQVREPNNPRRANLDLSAWIDRYSWSDKGYYWLNDHPDTVFGTSGTNSVITVFRILGKKGAPFNGIVLFNLKTAYFRTILNNVTVSPNGNIALISPEGVLYSKEVDARYDIGENGLAALRANKGQGSLNLVSNNNEKMFVVYNSMDINNWIVAAIVPESDVLEKAGQIKYVSIALIVLVVFLSSITATWFANSISKSIMYLSNQIRKVEDGNLNVEFTVKDNNEIGVLAGGLTSLIRTVNNLLHQVREEQEKKRKLELLVLQSQINPHFLYNTLASIQQLIDYRDNEKAGKMLGAVTRFFRIAISKGRDIIPVQEEIGHIRDYLTIQQMRYSQDFDFEFDISDELLNGYMIKLTLQPIVENSIYHGIKNKYDRGRIRISGRRAGPDIVFEVFDDGAGIPEERLDRLVRSINQSDIELRPITFGLKNVNQRIKLYHGQQYGIIVESTLHEYTRVTVTVPLLSQSPQEEEDSNG